MPLYEYRCHKCGKVFETIQRFSDAPLVIHEECGGEVERLLSAPAFHLKGSGWYATDYGKGGSKPTENKKSDTSKDSSAGDKSDSKSGETSSGEKGSGEKSSSTETKTESKPAATSSPKSD
jgi:putative FmdB family regulatory protein